MSAQYSIAPDAKVYAHTSVGGRAGDNVGVGDGRAARALGRGDHEAVWVEVK